MKKVTSMISAILILAVILCMGITSAVNAELATGWVKSTYSVQTEIGKTSMALAAYFPSDYNPEDTAKKYRVVLFLNGLGERGTDYRNLNCALFNTLINTPEYAKDTVILAPQCPKDDKWVSVDFIDGRYDISDIRQTKASRGVVRIIKELVGGTLSLNGATYGGNIDTSKMYITGLSMGGFGTWDMIARYPNMFAAAYPICGGMDITTDVSGNVPGAKSVASIVKNIPIRVVHGTDDGTVHLDGVKKMMGSTTADSTGLLAAAGNTDSRVDYLTGYGHSVWNPAYGATGIQAGDEALCPNNLNWMFGKTNSSFSFDGSIYAPADEKEQNGNVYFDLTAATKYGGTALYSKAAGRDYCNVVGAKGTYVAFNLPDMPSGKYSLSLVAMANDLNATIQTTVNGKSVGSPLLTGFTQGTQVYSDGFKLFKYEIGECTVYANNNTVIFENVGDNGIAFTPTMIKLTPITLDSTSVVAPTDITAAATTINTTEVISGGATKRYEAEDCSPQSNKKISSQVVNDNGCNGNNFSVLGWDAQIGDTITYTLENVPDGKYNIYTYSFVTGTRSEFAFEANGKVIGDVNYMSSNYTYRKDYVGTTTLSGNAIIKMTICAVAQTAGKSGIYLDCFELESVADTVPTTTTLIPTTIPTTVPTTIPTTIAPTTIPTTPTTIPTTIPTTVPTTIPTTVPTTIAPTTVLTEAEIIYGDINSDKSVNAKDVLRLKQYLAEWKVEIDRRASDVNVDNAVNAKDLLRLRQYLADWKVSLGK